MKISETLILDILRKLDISGLDMLHTFAKQAELIWQCPKYQKKTELWLYHNTPEHISNHLMVSNGTDLLGKPILNEEAKSQPRKTWISI